MYLYVPLFENDFYSRMYVFSFLLKLVTGLYLFFVTTLDGLEMIFLLGPCEPEQTERCTER